MSKVISSHSSPRHPSLIDSRSFASDMIHFPKKAAGLNLSIQIIADQIIADGFSLAGAKTGKRQRQKERSQPQAKSESSTREIEKAEGRQRLAGQRWYK